MSGINQVVRALREAIERMDYANTDADADYPGSVREVIETARALSTQPAPSAHDQARSLDPTAMQLVLEEWLTELGLNAADVEYKKMGTRLFERMISAGLASALSAPSEQVADK